MTRFFKTIQTMLFGILSILCLLVSFLLLVFLIELGSRWNFSDTMKIIESNVKYGVSNYRSLGISDEYFVSQNPYIYYDDYTEILISVLDEYNTISYPIREAFEKDNWTIIITDDKNVFSDNDENSDTYIAAECVYDKKCIYIYNSNNISYINGTLAHEMCHFMDYKCDFISDTEIVKNIYFKESSKLIYFFGLTPEEIPNVREFLANSYRLFISNPDKLLEYCPMSYYYLSAWLE